MPWLHPLQLIANTYMVTCTLRVSSLCMQLHIILVCWVGILLSNKWPFAITFSENGGWVYFQEATVLVSVQLYMYVCRDTQYSTERNCVTLLVPLGTINWAGNIKSYQHTTKYTIVSYLFFQALNELWFLFHRGPQLSLLTSRLHQRKIITCQWIWLYWLVCRYIQCTCTGYVQYAHPAVNWEELCYTPGAIQNKLNYKPSWKHDILRAYNNTQWYVTVTHLFSQALNELWFLFHRGPQLSLLTSRLHQGNVHSWKTYPACHILHMGAYYNWTSTMKAKLTICLNMKGEGLRISYMYLSV